MSDRASHHRPSTGGAGKAPRSPQLFTALRGFCLGAFFDLGLELEGGADLPIALEEHAGPNRPTLYEYRPLVGSFIEQRAGRLALREDAREALSAPEGRAGRRNLRERARRRARRRGRGPAPHRPHPAARQRPRRPAAASTGTTPRSNAPTSSSSARFYGDRRSYTALAPLVGLTAGGRPELGRGVRVRPAAANELTASWPDAGRLLPRDWGREVDRTLVLELEAELDSQACRVPDAPGEFGRAVSALRLATPGRDRRRAGRLRAARLPAIRRAADAGDGGAGAARPGDSPGRLPRAPRGRAADAAGGGARATSSRRSTAGSSRSSTEARTVPTSFARRSRRSLGCDEGPWAAAMRAAVLLGETAREREDLLDRAAGLARRRRPRRTGRGRRPARARRDAARRLPRAARLPSSTRPCSGFGRGPRSAPRPACSQPADAAEPGGAHTPPPLPAARGRHGARRAPADLPVELDHARAPGLAALPCCSSSIGANVPALP